MQADHAPADFPICVDGRMLAKQATGVASYARTMLASLQSAGAEIGILGDRGEAFNRTPAGKLLAAMRPGPRRLARAADGYHARDIFREAHVHFGLYRRLTVLRAPGPPGVMHWTYPVPLWIEGWRNVYTVHDVIPLDVSLASPVNPDRLMSVLTQITASADRLVAVSDAARADIVTRLGCDPSFVTNCSQAVDVTMVGAPGMLPAPLIKGHFYLYAGAFEAHKNLERLIEAHRSSGVSHPLVLVGPDGPGPAYLAGQVDGATPLLIRLPYQDRPTLLRMIADARALLFPSLAEGFGLPVVEAMALGTPVVTSRGGALEEVAGSAALLVDARDVGSIARAIACLDAQDALRDRLARDGRARALAFGRPAYAARLMRLYQDVWTNGVGRAAQDRHRWL